jgi:NhaA family Na+:H+ antiporter
VLLAFAIPFGNGDERSPSYLLQNFLHKPVAFFILPVFALANTCILIDDHATGLLGSTISLGIIIGLVVGKPIGILTFTWLATALRVSTFPGDLKWSHVLGGGLLAGIGFTMSIFITLLAFDDPSVIDASKLSIMLASLSAGILGFVWLRLTLKQPQSI